MVFMGIENDSLVPLRIKNSLSGYNIIVGKVYKFYYELGRHWIIIDDVVECIVDRDMMKYFKPLPEVRNNKIDEILN